MSTPEATRPLRADARRNREKIVAAARDTFSAQGVDAQMDDIARAAGVGVGTVYRHFPTKDALIAAMVVDKMTLMAGLAPAYLEWEDPWAAFTAYVGACAEQHERDRTLAQVTSTQPAATFTQAAQDTGLLENVGRLLRRAQDAGIARPDLVAGDVGIMMCGMGAALQAFGAEGGRRHLAIMLAGMRNHEAPPLSGTAPRDAE